MHFLWFSLNKATKLMSVCWHEAKQQTLKSSNNEIEHQGSCEANTVLLQWDIVLHGVAVLWCDSNILPYRAASSHIIQEIPLKVYYIIIIIIECYSVTFPFLVVFFLSFQYWY